MTRRCRSSSSDVVPRPERREEEGDADGSWLGSIRLYGTVVLWLSTPDVAMQLVLVQ